MYAGARIAIGAAIAVAAFVAPGACAAQTRAAATDARAQLVDRITAIRAEQGATSLELIGLLHVLGLMHQENGEHAPAIVALEDARHVTRVHGGLYSVDEGLLLMQQIRSEEALGLHERAWELQQSMLTIARRHIDELRVAPMFRALAEDRTEALRQYRAGKIPPAVALGCYYERTPVEGSLSLPMPPNCHAGSRDDVIKNLRQEILMHYAEAIEVIVKNGAYASDELRDLEEGAFQVARVSELTPSCFSAPLDELLALELVGSCLDPVVRGPGQGVGANVGGWASLVRLIVYEVRSGASAAARASAIAELADWHLLSAPGDRRRFEQSTATALETYELAYGELERDADARERAMQLFSPEVPITLPIRQRNPFASAAAAASARYIDVTFDVTKYGTGERIEILATSVGATRGEERDLIRLIEGTSFRPRMVDGTLADAAPVALRYHLAP